MSEMTNVTTCLDSFFAENSSECYGFPYYFIIFSLATNVALGFPAHFYILWLSMKEMIQGKSLEIFIFNTSLIEIIFNFCFPFVIKQYFFKCFNCKYVTPAFGLVTMIGRPLFQTFTCVERYIAVLYPVTFLKFKPMKYRITISVIGWVLIIGSCLSVALGALNIFNLLLAEYVAFLSTKVFTCLMVLKALKRPGPGEDVKPRDGVNRDKVKAFRIIQIVLASSLFMYTPVIICLLLYFFLDFNTFLISWSICLCSGIMSGFVQPCLYLKRIVKVCLCFNF